LFAALRNAAPATAQTLAEIVTPRFDANELVLPPGQQRQLDEIETAMRSLARVHFCWGTARVWNDSGVSVLFAGPSGTGKTMAAEVLAGKLDLPMYRINLAQVVNKYIGETEKNLERVFDSVDACESVLLFDEADSLFGRRTEVRDSHDRYANLEISYLLMRMERFKGLVILATNRRRDLDDAFVRRLRYIVEFPFPDVAERRILWRSILPEKVDTSCLDIDFLARQFQLSGGNIRSAVFSACLQSAARLSRSATPALQMNQVVIAVKREYDKMQRTIGLDQFGAYADVIESLDHE
jgi:SpoVK/Ycf46/Vps4 family AAA+-type ATPase